MEFCIYTNCLCVQPSVEELFFFHSFWLLETNTKPLSLFTRIKVNEREAVSTFFLWGLRCIGFSAFEEKETKPEFQDQGGSLGLQSSVFFFRVLRLGLFLSGVTFLFQKSNVRRTLLPNSHLKSPNCDLLATERWCDLI